MDSAAADYLTATVPGPPGVEEEVPDDLAALTDEQMAEAIALNQQLKAMVLEVEQREREQRRQQLARSRPSQNRGGSMSHFRPDDVALAHTKRPLGQATSGGWGGLTHSKAQSDQISRNNQILVTKLQNISTGRKPQTAQQYYRPPSRASASINRRRMDDQIARENAAMARRLNSVRPVVSNKKASHAGPKNKALVQLVSGPGRSPDRNAARALSAHSAARSGLPSLGLPRALKGKGEVRDFQF